ncbi:amidophosphoribosyltransferase, chloroplastic-like [Panicum miliaceum]|uniref:Amidophosphoribosyltransferase n=1 Tax=Panicum miliaceum TaxID=4540 RepID=A0A3L6SV43_PANMI|nr:amidophosphoribosyltransferase, chloroplastic-like [Panicum miliaceum]
MAATAAAAAATTTPSSPLLRRAAAAPTTGRHYHLGCSTKPSPLELRHRAARLATARALLPDRVTPFSFDADGDDHPREECGVFGVIGDLDASSLCYLGLQKLQHRGEEGAGIAASGADGKLKSVTGLGLVGDVFGDPARLAKLPGDAAIGHVRYSTAGASSMRNVQPFLAAYRFGQLAVAHNGNLVNYQALRSKLEAQGSIFNTSSDTEVILHLIATSLSRPLLSRICDACERLAGAYSLLFLTADKLFAVRDPFGFRPLVMGRRPNGAIVFASETCALDLIDAAYEREVEPGEVVVVDRRDMSVSYACLVPHRPRKSCVFEHIYFALPNSVVFGHAVHERRSAYGRALAEESPAPTADVVIPVPDSGFYAALGFAQASGLEFQQGLIRWHYSGRSFIQPSQAIRDLAVKLKLAPVRGVITGKSVVVVDDSLVRGTTSSKIVRLLRDAGAREVHMRIASPPVIGSCLYGIDTPSEGELISNRMDLEGVRRSIGCDSLAFLSLDKLHSIYGDEAHELCDACFSRNYPVLPTVPEPVPELVSAFED